MFGLAGVLAFKLVSPTNYAKLSQRLTQGLKDNLPALASQTDKVKDYATTLGQKFQNNSMVKSAIEAVKPVCTSAKNSLSQLLKPFISK